MEDSMTRNDVIREIREALRRRSGRAWSVTGGRGTAYGWITIDAPPIRRTSNWDGTGPGSHSTPADRAELARLLGLDGIHPQGQNVPAGHDYYREYLHRARFGKPGDVVGTPYWD